LSKYYAKSVIRFALIVGPAGLLGGGGVLAQQTESLSAASSSDRAATIPRAPGRDQIAGWLAELNHDAFAVRQAAAASLLSAGMAAREQLIAIANGPDPETRATARRLVALIDRSEFHRRLAAFAADSDGRQGLVLPGWEKFRAIVGGDPASRALFVEMQRREGALFAAAFGASDQSPEELLEARATRLLQWPATVGARNSTPSLGSCATLVFLATVPRNTISENGAMFVSRLIESPPIRVSLQPAPNEDALRRLVVYWILNCTNRSELILSRRLALISNLKIEEGLELSLAVAAKSSQFPNISAITRANAVLIAGQLGRPETVDRLESLLDDSSVCITAAIQPGGQPVGAVQMRDVALVVMLQLTNQQPADYGYVNARFVQPQEIYQLTTLSRDNDPQRAEAIAKWRAWRAAEKKASQANN
jgi:hypothetical protein